MSNCVLPNNVKWRWPPNQNVYQRVSLLYPPNPRFLENCPFVTDTYVIIFITYIYIGWSNIIRVVDNNIAPRFFSLTFFRTRVISIIILCFAVLWDPAAAFGNQTKSLNCDMLLDLFLRRWSGLISRLGSLEQIKYRITRSYE